MLLQQAVLKAHRQQQGQDHGQIPPKNSMGAHPGHRQSS